MSANNSHVIGRSSFLNGPISAKAGAMGDKRQQGLLLPIKGDKAGKTEAPATAKRRRA